MRKIFLTLVACLVLVTSSAHAKILKDVEGFSYIISYNYLIFSGGSQVISYYDLSSIHIIADNSNRFEFNVITAGIGFHGEQIFGQRTSNVREDYSTGNMSC